MHSVCVVFRVLKKLNIAVSCKQTKEKKKKKKQKSFNKKQLSTEIQKTKIKLEPT